VNELIKFDVVLDTEVKSFNCTLFEYKDKPVLLTYQVAYLLNIDSDSVTYNFNSHIDEFEEDDDYFKLEGDTLRDFKGYIKNVTVHGSGHDTGFARLVENINRISKLYLWTEEGVSNHAKISNSKNAWKIFKVIKKVYFKVRDGNQISVLQKQLSEVYTMVNNLSNSFNSLAIVVKEQKPKVDAFNMFMSTGNYLSMEEVAKAISDKFGNGKIMGKNNLLQYLRTKQVLTKTNLPYQRFIDSKLFGVHIKTYDNGQKYSQVAVSSNGMLAIISSLKKDNFI